MQRAPARLRRRKPDPGPPPGPRFLERPRVWRGALAIIFLIACAWKLALIARLHHGPLLHFLSADARTYWNWSGEIRGGQVIPTAPFFLSPLYPYALAVLRSIAGDRLTGVLALQAGIGAVGVTLLTDAARRLASPKVAIGIGLALAGYGMLAFFDVQILGETLLFALGSLLIWWIAARGVREPVVLGALIGLLALGRPVFLVFLLPIALQIRAEFPSGRLPRMAGLLALPLAVALLTAWHHQRVMGAAIPFSYSGPYNLYVGNGPEANGTYVPLTDPDEEPAAAAAGGTSLDGRDFVAARTGRPAGLAGSASFFAAATWNAVAADPGRAATLYLRKVAMLLNHRPLPQIASPAVFDRAAPVLGWPLDIEFVPFGVLGLFAIPFALRRSGASRTIGVGVLLLIGTTALFFVVDRYRIQVLPPLAVLSALGARQVEAVARRGGLLARSGILIAVLALGYLTLLPLIPRSRVMDDWEWSTSMGSAWLDAGEADRALPLLQYATRLEASGRLPGSESRASRLARAAAYENLGFACRALDRWDEASDAFETAASRAPDVAEIQLQRAHSLVVQGFTDRAIAEYAKLGIPRDRAAELLDREAAAAQSRGVLTESLRWLEGAEDLRPGDERTLVGLVRANILLGDLVSARGWLMRAAREGVDAEVLLAHAAWIARLAGDEDQARRILDRIPLDRRTSDPRIAGTIAMMNAGPIPKSGNYRSPTPSATKPSRP